MTNSSLSSVLKFAAVPALGAVLFAGCGPKDGSREYADGQAAYAVPNLEKAERLFSKCLERSPDNVDALVMLARVQCDRGEIAAAGVTVARAVELCPTATDVMMLDAETAFWAKDYVRAARRFAEVAESSSEGDAVRAMGWTGLGIVEMACNRRDLARLAFLRAIRLDRRNPSARYHLGLLYRGDDYSYLEAALEQFDIFVRLGEKADPRAQHVQRVIIPGIKDEIARRAAERSGADKRNSDASAAALNRASAAVKKGNFKTARSEYEAAYKADVLSYPAALGLARMWEKTDTTAAGRQKTLDWYKVACSLRPSAVSTFITAGALAAQIGQHATAAELYSRAVAANPADISAIDGLIRALRKVGNQAKVADAYQRYRDFIFAPVKK